MGSGKTSWAIQEMNEHLENSYIFVTPFLDEIDRIKKYTNIDFFDPKQKGHGKLDSFHNLLSNGKNIAVTHKLFTMITNETRDLINNGKYILIIDEALDVIEVYKDLKDGDRKHLLKSNTISIDQNGYVIWNEELDYDDYTFDITKRAAQNKCLVMYGDTIFLWQFPPDTFTICDHVYILTYNFSGSLMSAYFELHNLEYDKKTICYTNEKYCICNAEKQSIQGVNVSKLINICDDYSLNEIGNKRNSALSATWFKRNQKSDIMIKLKNNITNYLINKMQCHSSDVMWTVYSDYETALTDKGRKFTRRLSADEQKRYTAQKKHGLKIDNDLLMLKCFVSCNARATNMYSDRSILVYAVNYFPNTCIVKYLTQKGIQFNEDEYAINGIVQWIWRSQIRNNKAINIYIPSLRMRDLLRRWMQTL